ncbi:maltose ABC transporter periplasmic protein [Candidatus Izimaplasma bacterium HR1]|uniref:ABC transporter substrate-binding protein n=1 Tax=Candidatus Izimoplasma sp. HR1 TaxID=1541959 RepID=UPI0004F863B1|nr:maltose ABC transporter periplasmic protein [Candidatus Izimaplasma bacterium HR1]
MKKLLLLVAALVLVLTLSACGGQKTLVIFQNKVEIDSVLRDYAEAWGEANDVVVEVKTCGGDTCAYGEQILAEFQGDEQPDIFVIEGMGGYDIYEDKILDVTGETWTSNTDLEFVVDGATYGFPVAVEGWGMAYNEDILTAAFTLEGAGRTIASIEDVSQAEYIEVFDAVQAYYDANDMDDYAVVSMAAASGMTWVTGLHNFNGYLSAGLGYTDNSVINDLNAGTVNQSRLDQLADWVEILFTYADEDILLTGTYDLQVGKFANGEAAFLHQGNWTDSSYDDSDFEMGYLPHAVLETGNDSIFIGAPSFYVINKDSDSIDDANAFLNDLAATTEGHEYMVNDAHMVPAFNSVTLTPATPLSAAVMEWNQKGKAYAWWQNDMPAGFGMDTLGPIYELYAKGVTGTTGGITQAEFIAQMKAVIEDLG